MDSVGEGEGGKIWENDIEACKISCKKKNIVVTMSQRVLQVFYIY